MGWLISHDLTKAQQVAELVKGWEKDGKGTKFLAHSVRGNVLFAVAQNFDRTTPALLGAHPFEKRWILVCLLRKDRGMGWGYKDMSESEGPYKYDCPLKFLKMAPVANETWREGVLAHHAKRREASKNKAPSLTPGTRVRFNPGFSFYGKPLVEGTILRRHKQGYIADVGNGADAKIFMKHIAEVLG